jgi:multicomponent Na+:H+ antiporter subunit D
VIVGLALICTGFFVKAAIVPFHFWLADAYAAAPAAVCVLFAGVMSELGIYGVARVLWTAIPHHAAGLGPVLLALGALTAVWGGVMSAVQRHLKRLLAFGTISHMGVLLIALGVGKAEAIAGAALYVVGDGAVKAGLFVAVSVLDDCYGAIDDVRLFGRGRDLPGLGAVVALGGLLMAGLPLAGPWLGREAIEAGGAWWIGPIVALVGALTGGAVLRVVRTVFLGRGSPGELDPATEHDDDDGRPEPSARSAWAWAPAALLIVFALIWGLVPGLADAAAAAGARFADTAGYARAVLQGATVAGPGAHAAAPALSAYLYGLLGCAGAIAIGAAPLPPVAALRPFRALHSGRVGDYLAWTAAGTAALAAACALALG